VFLIHATKLTDAPLSAIEPPHRRNHVVNETDLQKFLGHFCNLLMFM
jgi:hypothetical protein